MRTDKEFFAALRASLVAHGRVAQGFLPIHFDTAFIEQCIRELEAKHVTGEPLSNLERMACNVMIGSVFGTDADLRSWAQSSSGA
jgi:hypothetical protein